VTVYRLPFDDDGQWTFDGLGNWDDPKTGPHQPYDFDFRHPVGGIVRAARGGEVVFVSNIAGNSIVDNTVPGYGTAVLVRHVDNTVVAYNHLKFDSLKVVMHQRVLQGQALGLSGNTGNSTAPHLHFGAVSFWNTAQDRGADFPMQFEDKHHSAWRPRIGETVAPTASGFREEQWRWCAKCHGLYFSGTPTSGSIGGACPTGGSHAHGGSANYLLTVNSNVAGQKGWRRCHKCQGLFFGGNPGSHCPAGGAHSKTDSGDYVVVHNTPTAPGQADWRWCSKCQGLFFAGNPGSTCPADHAQHTTAGSGNYTLAMMGPGDPQPGWRRCSKCQGLFIDGNPGSKCPVDQGAHSKASGASYVLMVDYAPGTAPGQPNWRWCHKCQGLFFAGNPTSKCPNGGAHSTAGSGNYTLVQNAPKAPGQTEWRWCNKCQGLFYGAKPAAKCPAGGLHTKTGSGNYSLSFFGA
jgi:hypothetical protein